MENYSWVSVTALFCYLFLFMAFLASKKTNVIRSFMFLQIMLILWTGGSFLMRIELWPSVNFWHYISLIGILMLPYAFFRFLLAFLEEKKSRGGVLWFVFYGMVYIVNLITGIFIPRPEVVATATGTKFIYQYTDWIGFLFFMVLVMAFQAGHLIYRHCRGNSLILRQIRPILLGAATLIVGHILCTFSYFRGFPLDIVSGLLYAVMTFYALYEKKLFKMTLLISRGNCYALALLISVIGFSSSILPLKSFLQQVLGVTDTVSIIIISLCMMVAVLVSYQVLKKFLDALFVKEELVQAENLKNFNLNISKTLNMDEILEELVQVIHKTIAIERVFVCIKSKEGQYKVEKTASALDEKNFSLDANHPLVNCLKSVDGCLLMSDFRRTTYYKSMWEQEKQLFQQWGIACMVGLRDGDELVGLVLLSHKHYGKGYHYDDISFLVSVSSVCTMAVKNSRLYETAYHEARYDELTGLLNRKCFYEVIETEFERCREQSIALVMLSVDDFKLYNQLYGSKEGDVALRKIADIIRTALPDRGVGFRLHGKEFALILREYDIYSAKVLAETICDQVRKMENVTDQYGMKVLTMSGGVCAAPYMASSVKELLSNTDMAVYSVKRGGKNAVIMYSQEVERKKNDMDKVGGKGGKYNDYASTIIALTAAIDTKDHYTFSHSQNVAYYAAQLGRAYGLSEEYLDILKEAGLLHDIGKIGIPELILNKPGKLETEEYVIMKSHVESSIGIIRHLPSLDYVIPAIISHHERYDGYGYPRGIAGEDIPLMGRILCVVDAFDAMVSERSYKKAMPIERAIAVLKEESGLQFDPKLVPLFISLVEMGTIQIQKRSVSADTMS